MGGIFQQYSWIFHLFVVLTSSFFLARISGVYIGKQLEVKRTVALIKSQPVAEEARTRKEFDAYKIILERNIFDSTPPVEVAEGEGGAESEAEAVPTGEAVKTSLDLKVLGVLVVGLGTDHRSSATISAGKGDIDVFAVGDEESFAPNTRLTKVRPDRIEFLNGGRLEYSEVGEEAGESIFGPPKQDAKIASLPKQAAAPGNFAVKQETPGKFTIDQAEVDNSLQNLDKLYTEIRAVPNFAGGKVSGMKILSVKSDSIFAKLGLQRGDILQRINGLELDVKQGFQIFNQLKDAKNLTVDLIRHGQPQSFDYEIR